MQHAILKAWHPMIGVDRHICWPPGSPSPAAPAPYFTAFTLMGTSVTASYANTHMSHGFAATMQQGTDIGPLIPHIGAPSILTPLDILASGSKSYFGSAANPVDGKPVACALLGYVNYNINCSNAPLPLPTGVVMAINTHMVSMSWADLLGGLAEMAIDVALEWALGRAGGWAGGRITGALRRRFGRAMWQQAVRQYSQAQGRVLTTQAARAFGHIVTRNYFRRVGTAVGRAVGMAIGSPIGGFGWTGWRSATGPLTPAAQQRSRAEGERLGSYFDGGDQVSDYP